MAKILNSRFLRVLRNQKGFSLAEFAIVMALVAVVSGVVWAGYSKVSSTNWAQTTADRFATVKAQLDLCRNDRNGTYPAAATAGAIVTAATTTTSGEVSSYVGSTSTDIKNWTYQCVSPGTSMIVTIVDAATPSADAQSVLINKINNAYPQAGQSVTATPGTATTVVVTFSGYSCAL
jgi:prepilin-type N-terminal cleavage/methylation domain-containing protein